MEIRYFFLNWLLTKRWAFIKMSGQLILSYLYFTIPSHLFYFCIKKSLKSVNKINKYLGRSVSVDTKFHETTTPQAQNKKAGYPGHFVKGPVYHKVAKKEEMKIKIKYFT